MWDPKPLSCSKGIVPSFGLYWKHFRTPDFGSSSWRTDETYLFLPFWWSKSSTCYVVAESWCLYKGISFSHMHTILAHSQDSPFLSPVLSWNPDSFIQVTCSFGCPVGICDWTCPIKTLYFSSLPTCPSLSIPQLCKVAPSVCWAQNLDIILDSSIFFMTYNLCISHTCWLGTTFKNISTSSAVTKVETTIAPPLTYLLREAPT